MNNKEVIEPYKTLFLGGVDNRSSFKTSNSIVYEVQFKSTSYIFDNYLTFPIDAFEFTISVAYNPTDKNPPLDPKIPFTIASIFTDFFQRIPEQVVVYICDSSDLKQSVRKRKFDQWVEYFKGQEFAKVNSTINDLDGRVYHNALIIRRDNPHYIEITEAFIKLAEEQDKQP
jgi:hypothetical protein